MNTSTEANSYGTLCSELYDAIGENEFNRIANLDKCFELCYYKDNPKESFLGFLQTYSLIKTLINEQAWILDFGCCWAAQSYMFKNYKQYIGIEPCIETYARFATPNTKHLKCSAQTFIKQDILAHDKETSFAICSYVPSDEAMNMIAKNYPNHLIVYPGKDDGRYDLSIKNEKLLRID